MTDFSVRFHTVTIPNVQTIRDNFANLTPHVTKIPGASGGFDQYGALAAPAETGTIDLTCYLVSDTGRGGMQALIDEMKGLAYLGKRKLHIIPQDAEYARWCWARLNNVSTPRHPAQHTDLHQSVTLNFQVSEPVLYAQNNEPWYLDDGHAIGDPGLVLWAEPVATLITETGSITVNNAGNAIALPRFDIVVPATKSAENITISRTVDGVAQETLAFVDTLSAADELAINCRSQSVTLNSTGAYADLDADHADWVRLMPGDNVLTFDMDNATDQINVIVYWYHTWQGM